jgi:hypothetical protein
MRIIKLTAAVLIPAAALGSGRAACGGASGSPTYQAKGGTRSGGAVVQSDSGTEVVGWIGEGGTLTFPDVIVPTGCVISGPDAGYADGIAALGTTTPTRGHQQQQFQQPSSSGRRGQCPATQEGRITRTTSGYGPQNAPDNNPNYNGSNVPQ